MSLTEVNFCYLIISGVPGIGKTTFCKAFTDYVSKNENTNENGFKLCSLMITYDEIMNKQIENELINKNSNDWKSTRSLIQCLVHLLTKFIRQKCNVSNLKADFESNLNYSSFNLQKNLYEDILKNFIDLIEKQLNNSIDKKDVDEKNYYIIILDDIFYYESMRHLYFKLTFKQELTSYFCLSFKVDNFDFVLERNDARDVDSKIDESILRNIFLKFEYPNVIEWEKEFSNLILVNENVEYNKNLFKNILESLIVNHSKFIKYKQSKIDEEKIKAQNYLLGQKSCQSLIHECDLILRKLVKEKMSNNKSANRNDLKLLAQKLNENKTKVFEIIKNQNSDLHLKLLAMNDLKEIEHELSSILLNDL